MHNKLAIFDLDETLLRGQSQKELLGYFKKHNLIPIRRFVIFSLWFLLYKIGFVKNPTEMMKRGYRLLEGKSVTEIEKHTDDFFEYYLKKLLFTNGIELIEKHKRKGDLLLLLSNSPDFLVKKIAYYLKIENFIGTRLEIKNGRFTGNIEKEIVYGENKLREAQTFAKHMHLDLKKAWAYGDDASDIFLMERTGHPVAVNPSRKLEHIAKAHAWPMLKFN